MKIECEGQIIDTDKERDYVALQYEKFKEFQNFCINNKIYICAFTVDAEGQGGGFHSLPDRITDEDVEIWNRVLTNMDLRIKQETNNLVSLKINKKFKFD